MVSSESFRIHLQRSAVQQVPVNTTKVARNHSILLTEGSGPEAKKWWAKDRSLQEMAPPERLQNRQLRQSRTNIRANTEATEKRKLKQDGMKKTSSSTDKHVTEVQLTESFNILTYILVIIVII